MGTAIFGDLPGPLPDPSLAGQVLTWNGDRWDLSTGAELGASIALADLSDVTAKTGTGTVVVMQTAPTLTTPKVASSVNDTNGNELIGFVSAGSAVNYLQIANASTGAVVVLTATGDDPVVALTIEATDGAIILSGSTVALSPTFASGATVLGNTIETQNNKAAASGYCDLDSSSLVPVARLPVIGGRLKSFQILTSGTTYTRPAGVVSILVECVAGGGGGGGAAQAASSAAAGGGGGAGSYAREWFAAASSTYTYAIGAAGAGGTAGNNNGAQGGATSFSTVATTGGAGGAGAPAGTTVNVATGGAGGGVATGADINGGGAPGGFGLTFTGTIAASGFGGSGHFGGGAGAATTERAGFAAAAYGSGGSGGCCLGTTARAGGVGFQGVVYVWEFS